MSPPNGPTVTKIIASRPFQKERDYLPASTYKEFKKFIHEMKAGDYPNSRRLKKRHGGKKNKKQWQARLDRNHRITFHFKDGVATMGNVGPHKNFD